MSPWKKKLPPIVKLSVIAADFSALHIVDIFVIINLNLIVHTVIRGNSRMLDGEEVEC